jgi:uncharacterized membrane protein YdbT with pleckstrin-like domain
LFEIIDFFRTFGFDFALNKVHSLFYTIKHAFIMEIFISSRLTTGNKLFPSAVIIDEGGVTLKIPGLFSGNEKTVPFTRISSVDIFCPFIGYSTISIETTGEGSIKAHGFTKAEVKRMKELILSNIQST